MLELEVSCMVKVHTLEWFERNHKSKSDDGNFILSSTSCVFVKSMQVLCGKYVTVVDKRVRVDDGKYSYKIMEDKCSKNWVDDFFFDLSTITDNYLDKVENYCNNFCILGDISNCSNVSCPLYNVLR